jgi:hypothetical protein
MSHVWTYRRFLGLAILVLSAGLVSSVEVDAQGMQQKGMDPDARDGGCETRDNRLRHRNRYCGEYGGSEGHFRSWANTGN